MTRTWNLLPCAFHVPRECSRKGEPTTQGYHKRQNKSQGQMMHRGILDREEGLLKQVFVWKTECKELKFVEVKD